MAANDDIISSSIAEIVSIAQAYAKENMSGFVEPSHIFKALLHKDAGLVSFLERDLSQDYYYLLDWADMRIKMEQKSSRPNAEIKLSPTTIDVIGEAEEIATKLGQDGIDAKVLLAATITPGVGFSFDQLKTLPLTPDIVLDKYCSCALTGKSAAGSASNPVSNGGPSKNIEKFCHSINDQIENAQIDPVIGFEKELSEIFDILGRRTKSNILITGESGVGKTSLVRAFAQAVVNGEVPSFLESARVYELDDILLCLEVSYKSEVEARMKRILDEITNSDNSILVIENLDKILDKQNILNGVLGILKSKLNQGLLTICTASIDGYTKNIEPDRELVGKFELIALEEPSPEYAEHILAHVVSSFEKYHGLTMSADSVTTSIRLAKRYFSEKRLPDSAIDMIDRTMALIKSANDMASKDIERVRQKLDTLKASKQDDQTRATEAKWLYHEIVNRISPIVISRIELKALSDFATIDERIKYLGDLLSELANSSAEKTTELRPEHLLAVVAQKTGIPMGNIQAKERDRLVNAEAIMKKRVVGQDHAIKIVLDSIYESRSGLNKKGQPMGSFFFLGPTGTGKTELAKSLADFLFQDESAILRFDMSEYKEEHSVALLYGAPPGYVGYEEGGLLVNKIRQNPYSVVLFDEIEKAHRSVFDLFLQILDEGKLHDRLGRVGDFSNALILFTSNIGSQYIFDSFAKGVVPTHNDMLEVMQGNFRPEFLARLTEIVPFSPITEEIVLKIFNIHLKGLLKTLAEQNITLEITDEAKYQIAMRGFNAQYGARPILGIIRKEIRRPLSKMIISGDIKADDKISLGLDAEKNLAWTINESQ